MFNNALSFLLIYPSQGLKEQFNNLVANIDIPINVYLYEHKEDEHEIDWLLTTNKIVNYAIFDIDNSPSEVRDIGSYLIANPQTYWLTNGEKMFYNKISNKRIYSLDYFNDKIGGSVEKQQSQE